VRISIVFVLALAGLGCREATPPAANTGPEAAGPVLDGWPGPLRPHLEPTRDLTVKLHGPSIDGPVVAECVLPEGQPVRWTRSRVQVHRKGRLTTTASTTVDVIRLAGLDRVNGLTAQDSLKSPLEFPADQTLAVVAQVGGRCLLQPSGSEAVLSIPCPTRALQLETPPEQSWWLELACSAGEGWFEVETEAYVIEHYPDEVLR
jgi:hypothetical protein